MSKYQKHNLENGKWVICETGKNYKEPFKTYTFALDTETLVYLDDKIQTQDQIFEALKECNENEKRKRLKNKVWAYQCYDEFNGFFMTNDFYVWLNYQCLSGYKFGWCYNATFDFSQFDYSILAERKENWKPHEHNTGHGYNKAQAWSYESLHSAEGARYCYKLWVPYRALNRHKHVHSVEYRDFLKLLTGGLEKVLKDLDVKDNEGNKIRKLEMDYQLVDPDNLTEAEIDYCCNDVKGLYFAVKIFNETVEAKSDHELHIFGKYTNIMTAGGLSKRIMLKSLYCGVKKQFRLKKFQKEHPITAIQDKWLRDNHLYRGGISYVNPLYKGRLITKEMTGGIPMYRFDVNSEYPYSMSILNDLVGTPKLISFNEWLKCKNKNNYEAIYILKSCVGTLKEGMLGLWYDPFKKDFVDFIDEEETHLMFERELLEMSNWYDLEFNCEQVIIIKRGGLAYKPFISKNYKEKRQAKQDGNFVLEKMNKLLLNSSYGKLAERISRQKAHYELNIETGAIHMVNDELEVDDSCIMSLFVGALTTCIARCYILSKIREICGEENGIPQVSKLFVYIDTDSIHCFKNYSKADAFTLGGLKLEATCDAIKYILPKTYIDIEEVLPNGEIAKDKNGNYKYEIHAKGINITSIQKELNKIEHLTVADIDKKFDYGQKYRVLQAFNVVGGKVLIPVEKYLAREEQAPNVVRNTGYYNER